MNENDAKEILTERLKADGKRMAILNAVAELTLPDGYVAAGFLRNLAWDSMHDFISEVSPGTPLNDVDIIFFDAVCFELTHPVAAAKEQEMALQEKLQARFPDLAWDVKNQARMHLRNHHSPYSNASDAMTFWPEKETAVGVRLNQNKKFEFVAPFGLSRLFQCSISHNDKREKSLFEERLARKNWLQTWPELKVIYHG